VSCHQNSGKAQRLADARRSAVSGNSSQVSEIRAGHNIVINGEIFKEAPGGSVIHQRAIDPRVQEHVPDREIIRSLRMSTNTLGGGFVEAIPDKAIQKVQLTQPAAV
jgi:hypothetical protein